MKSAEVQLQIVVADVVVAGLTVGAVPAGRKAEHHVVANVNPRHIRPDFFHDARSFVPKHGRRGGPESRLAHFVRVADAARGIFTKT
jgi:hypothetical protein